LIEIPEKEKLQAYFAYKMPFGLCFISKKVLVLPDMFVYFSFSK